MRETERKQGNGGMRETERESEHGKWERGIDREEEGTGEWGRGIDREEICGIISLIRGIITEPNKHKFVFYFVLINL